MSGGKLCGGVMNRDEENQLRQRGWFFISKFISKNIDHILNISCVFAGVHSDLPLCKILQTRMNTRKTRNHKGCGFSFLWQREKDSNIILFS